MNLPFPVLLGIEKAIEAVLRLDEPTRTRLAELDGKTIQVNLSSPNLSLLLSVVGSAVHLSQAEPDTGEVMGITADATISGSLSALRSLIDGNDAIYTGKVTLEGDIGVGQSLKQLLAQLDPDWQDAVSPVLGDGLTHRLDMAQTGFFAWLGRTRTAASSNTSEYLQEELELLAPNSLVRGFCEEVDELRSAADRLEARLKRLEPDANEEH
jgi:ubiquinone biosynthesis protein UbiJ